MRVEPLSPGDGKTFPEDRKDLGPGQGQQKCISSLVWGRCQMCSCKNIATAAAAVALVRVQLLCRGVWCPVVGTESLKSHRSFNKSHGHPQAKSTQKSLSLLVSPCFDMSH